MIKRSILRGFILVLISGFLASSSVFANAQKKIGTLTITTYYPSPFGVYNELRAKRMAIGDTYYDSSTTPINDPADLIAEGNVGIGTSDPAAQLEVRNDDSADMIISSTNNQSFVFIAASEYNGDSTAGIELRGPDNTQSYIDFLADPNPYYGGKPGNRQDYDARIWYRPREGELTTESKVFAIKKGNC